MVFLLLFILGLFIGSFLNVLSLRYEEGKTILGWHIARGRSHCMKCKEDLRWFELIPLLSFLMQRGRCRHCFHIISWQYPIVETITGLITAFIPLFFYSFFHVQQAVLQGQPYEWFYIFSGLWLITAYTLITASVIDFRLKIIPDQSNVLLAVLGIAILTVKYSYGKFFPYQGSFSSFYTEIFGAQSTVSMNVIFAILLALAIFGGIILFSKGRGMGMGDLKLAIAMAFLLSWPDVIIAYSAAFIIGGAIGLLLLARQTKKFKDSIPFGPYLAIGIFIAIFYAEPLLKWYFSLVQ